jgi:hypothetical protein
VCAWTFRENKWPNSQFYCKREIGGAQFYRCLLCWRKSILSSITFIWCRNRSTRWFKYDRDKLWLVYTQIVPVIFEPPCIKMSDTRQLGSRGNGFEFYYRSTEGRTSLFRRVRKIAKKWLFHVRPSVRMEQFGSHWTDFDEVLYLSSFRKSSFISNLSYDRSTASSKTIPPLNAI